MPTRMLQRRLPITIEDLHANHLVIRPGWTNTTPEDIDRVAWVVDNTTTPATRAMRIYRRSEGLITRWIEFSDTETYNLLISGQPNWAGGPTIIDRVEFDAAGRGLMVFKIEEAA